MSGPMAGGPDGAGSLGAAEPAAPPPVSDAVEHLSPYLEMRQKLREKIAAGTLSKPQRTRPVEQGGCPRCFHEMIALDSGYFCPCEDCHNGGVIVRKSVIARS